MSANNKLIGLVLGIVLALFACYKLAFENTLALRKEYVELSKESNQLSKLQGQVLGLSKKEISLDSALTSLKLDDSSIDTNLLRFLNENASDFNAELIDFNPVHEIEQAAGITATYDFTLRGSFLGLLRMVHKLETDSGFGKVTHAKFHKTYDYKRRKHFLDLTLFIERYQ